MVRAEYKGDSYEVTFSYSKVTYNMLGIPLNRHPTKTECKIFKNKELFSNGIAIPHYTELEFVKSIGRRVSLEHAVSKFERGLRIKIWEAYKEKCDPWMQ